MLLIIEKQLFRRSSNLLRRYLATSQSHFAQDLQSHNNHEDFIMGNEDFPGIRKDATSIAMSQNHFAQDLQDHNSHEDFIIGNEDLPGIRRDDIKSLKVAIIGLPNVGKSTLINRLIGRPVCAVASRFHVTRKKTNAIYSNEDTQLVFIDTPGLVSGHEFKKFNLEESFKLDAKNAMESADIVGVVQDVSNKHTRGVIQDKILELVKLTRVGVPSILIMNKIDQMKKKRELLSLVRSLTGERGWPNFSDVFMVSALTSDGVDDLRNYLLDSAKPRDWEFSANVSTDEPPEKLVERSVRAKLLETLPNEVPYKLKIETEHFDSGEDDTIYSVVNVRCPTEKISKMVMGKSGSRLRIMARDAEQEMSNAFRTSVRLKIAVYVDNQ